MTPDNWATLHRRAAELLHAIVLWNPGPATPSWQAMCPHIARLTKILVVADVLDETGHGPVEPVWRRELLDAATAAGEACERHGGGLGDQRPVRAAATRLRTAVAAFTPPELAARAS
jgi:hypothetical protein